MIRSGGWGTKLVLGGLAGISLTRALAYAPWTDHPTVKSLTYIEQFAPLWVYSILWAISCALLCVAIGCDKYRAWATGASIAISALWAFSYVSSWIWLDQSRAWVTASYYVFNMVIALGVGLRSPKPRGW